MLTESEKRAVTLAVSRYGADRARIDHVVDAVLQAQAQGRPADLLDSLVGQCLLTPAQAAEVRAALDVTQVDVAAAADPARSKPRPTDRLPAVAAPAPQADGEDGKGAVELRSLGEYRILRRRREGGRGSGVL